MLAGLFLFAINHYHIGEGPGHAKEVAKWIVEKKKSPNECLRIIRTPAPFPGMSQSNMRSLCVKYVAALKQDASVCIEFIPKVLASEIVLETDFVPTACLEEVEAAQKGNSILLYEGLGTLD